MSTVIRTTSRRRVPVVQVHGDVDLAAVDALRDQLEALSSGDTPEVVVDLTGATFIDSTGLGVLVGARAKLAQRGARLTLVLERESLWRTLRISSLTRLFTLHRTLEEAVPAARQAVLATAPTGG